MVVLSGITGTGRTYRRCEHRIERRNHIRDYETAEVSINHIRTLRKNGAMLYMSGESHSQDFALQLTESLKLKQNSVIWD